MGVGALLWADLKQKPPLEADEDSHFCYHCPAAGTHELHSHHNLYHHNWHQKTS